MGAHNIEFTLDRKASRSEIDAAFQRQRENDADENGHAQGYSGDFQTVRRVDYSHLDTDKVFTSYNEAHDFCLKNASKWETVVAVYFCNSKIESRKLTKLTESLNALQVKLRDLESTPLSRAKHFATCEHCQSKVALKHFHGASCPVCRTDLRPDRLLRSIAKLKAKVDALTAKRADLIKAERQKLVKKPSHIKTMVAGWGAS